METPKVFQFIQRFMSDEAFRFDVLHKEKQAMDAFGLTPNQRDTFRSLVAVDIKNMLHAEAMAAGADVDKAFGIIFGGQPCDAINALGGAVPSGAAGGPMAAASMYHEGQIHIRCVDPSSAPAGVVQVWLRAHGFAANPEFEFRLQGANPPVSQPGTVTVQARVADDLFQRARVQGTLTAGTWEIYARNPEEGDFDMTAPPIKTITIT